MLLDGVCLVFCHHLGSSFLLGSYSEERKEVPSDTPTARGVLAPILIDTTTFPGRRLLQKCLLLTFILLRMIFTAAFTWRGDVSCSIYTPFTHVLLFHPLYLGVKNPTCTFSCGVFPSPSVISWMVCWWLDSFCVNLRTPHLLTYARNYSSVWLSTSAARACPDSRTRKTSPMFGNHAFRVRAIIHSLDD